MVSNLTPTSYQGCIQPHPNTIYRPLHVNLSVHVRPCYDKFFFDDSYCVVFIFLNLIIKNSYLKFIWSKPTSFWNRELKIEIKTNLWVHACVIISEFINIICRFLTDFPSNMMSVIFYSHQFCVLQIKSGAAVTSVTSSALALK